MIAVVDYLIVMNYLVLYSSERWPPDEEPIAVAAFKNSADAFFHGFLCADEHATVTIVEL